VAIRKKLTEYLLFEDAIEDLLKKDGVIKKEKNKLNRSTE
jgi:hypothetical protein